MKIALVCTTLAVGFGATVFATTPRAETPGDAGYSTHCAGCHQPAGEGMGDTFPALAGAALVKGEPGAVIDVVLKGRGVNMPPFADTLSDTEIADIVSHVRTSWGNGASAVTAADVAARKSAAK